MQACLLKTLLGVLLEFILNIDKILNITIFLFILYLKVTSIHYIFSLEFLLYKVLCFVPKKKVLRHRT